MGADDDKEPVVHLQDVPASLGLLTRLPVPVDGELATMRGARAAWAYPLAGFVLAVIAAALGKMLLSVGLPPQFVAGLVLVTLVVLTGAMHEDGLADAADGLWGGWDPARRLEIMKDSRIGAYGVIALVLSLGLRWQALALLIAAEGLWQTVLVAAVLSRAMMVPVMARLPHARADGLSKSVGQPPMIAARLAEAIAIIVTVLAFGWNGLLLLALALVATLLCALLARAKIGGQTGDILGATQQVVEITILLAAVALLA